ncbi:spermidine/putrescine ABC transporter ATP-binding protein [Alkalihalobacillus alcalophilus ATCC 27647 = CGMCC 1.3604]|uniref:Nitrate/sulfonate/taurine transporter n=1 Tax=Alkalihalobacillus alcalophilus ATCC 27647 = CGMCC 1.3604 TaxID=1218173 RepID=J8T784_ALKAL|nr:ABC transporter ATP-binding protein [Alkalihalobacillus alcalophilus]AFV25911.1 nitrate/sulfonate/taurine transporter [Alkalihalobacillus alcalophilus ATCC 27647 = CGMCC 1.3604]KGA98783.1 spermidine/putrescine ABC transporter ATP-binding protein [Alkalihalobacillus alcalophilus ATCC 27647 = CGMCC 1.3604]MED1560965.1 ABC transporter ATP-binding protein [Alkalihalobacillus alcalophilus]THG90496.1 spermidine/putrescine ABC transporter ATP-binding protein [Alkalihalobacillus alcalophilus ATCC 27
MAKLTIQDVSKIYLTKEEAALALEDITLTINEGEFISIIGPSGCGKTTLLSLISGILKPTKGKILLNEKRIEPKTTNIGYMLQQDYLFPWLTIESNITIGQHIRHSLDESSRRRALNLLDAMGLLDKKSLYPAQLSGGMRQRVALIRMLASDPSFMLLDEPFSALDYQTKLKLEDLVFKTLKREGKTAILVTHDIGEAISMSDRVVLLNTKPGRIHRIFDIPKEIKELIPFDARQTSAYTEQFNLIWEEMESLEPRKTS